MSAFQEASLVEARARVILEPFVEDHATGLVWTNKGPLARHLQQTIGDALFNDLHGTLWSVEMKAEQRETGNIFFETWSNKNLDNGRAAYKEHGINVGWGMKQKADWLFYYFLDTDNLYIVDLFSLQKWLFGVSEFGKPVLDTFREVPQGKYRQANATCGRLVPLAAVRANVKLFFTASPRQLALDLDDCGALWRKSA